MARIRRLPASHGLQVNMTPMIDVVFLLIVFFMLVSRIASEEVAQGVDLPEIVGTEIDEEMPPQRVLINLLWMGEGREPEYRVGSLTVETISRLERILKDSKRNAPQLIAILRADRRINYKFVRTVMERVALAEIEIMHLHIIEEAD